MIKDIVGFLKKRFHKHTPVFIGKELQWSDYKTCEARCSKCGQEMFGYYSKGELSKEWFWTFTEI